MKINMCISGKLRRTFVRQEGREDCGVACLAMLLRYAGKAEQAKSLLDKTPEGAQSLLELKNQMAHLGYLAKCVEMTTDHLSVTTNPCILHTEDKRGNKHYQVCYGLVKIWGQDHFLMADPASHFYYISRSDLEIVWRTKFALFIADLEPGHNRFGKEGFIKSIKSAQLPSVILIIIPLISVVNALFGAALSFLLQRGIADTNEFQSPRLILAFAILLLAIIVFKGAFSHIGQLVLLRINRQFRGWLFSILLSKIKRISSMSKTEGLHWKKSHFHEISLIQNAFSLFISSFVSEGSIVIIMLGAVTYTLPLDGLILFLCFFWLAFITLAKLPGMLHKNYAIRLKSSEVEQLLTTDIDRSGLRAEEVLEKEKEYIAAAEAQAICISKQNFFDEIIRALSLVTILVISALQLYLGRISYANFMLVVILSYITLSLTPRIHSSYCTFSEGLDALNQFILRTQ